MDRPSEFPPSREPDIWEDWLNARSDFERRDILLTHGVPPELLDTAGRLFPSADQAVTPDGEDPEPDHPDDVPLPRPEKKDKLAEIAVVLGLAAAIITCLSGFPDAVESVRSGLRAIGRLFS